MRLNMYRYFPAKRGEVVGTDIFMRGSLHPTKGGAKAMAESTRSRGFRARVVRDSDGYTVWVSKHKAAGRRPARLSR